MTEKHNNKKNFLISLYKHNRMKIIEERVNELEDCSIDIIQSKQSENNRENKTEPWGSNNKRSNIQVIGNPEGEEKDCGVGGEKLKKK